MEGNHFHVFVRDLPGALAWFAQVWAAEPAYRGERMAVLQFGPILLVLDQDEDETVTTIGYATANCDADFRRVVGRGAQVIEEPADRSWGCGWRISMDQAAHPGTGTRAAEGRRGERRLRHLMHRQARSARPAKSAQSEAGCLRLLPLSFSLSAPEVPPSAAGRKRMVPPGGAERKGRTMGGLHLAATYSLA